MEKKIIIIGNDGAVGKELYKKLRKNKKYIFSSKSKSADIKLNLNNINFGKLPNPKDISCVVLIAGITSLKKCEMYPKLTKRINVTNSFKLLEYFHLSKKIILSSSSVFDGLPTRAKINDKKSFINAYGMQKSNLEDMIINKLNNYCIIRCTKILTPSIPLHNEIKKKVNKKEIFFAYNDIYLQPIIFNDFFNFILKVIKTSYKKNKIFHLNGNKKILSIDFAKLQFQKLKLNEKYLQGVSGIGKKTQPNLLIKKIN